MDWIFCVIGILEMQELRWTINDVALGVEVLIKYSLGFLLLDGQDIWVRGCMNDFRSNMSSPQVPRIVIPPECGFADVITLAIKSVLQVERFQHFQSSELHA